MTVHLHQLAKKAITFGFEENYETIKAKGIDEIIKSVNDSFVMNAWAEKMQIQNVKMIPDGS